MRRPNPPPTCARCACAICCACSPATRPRCRSGTTSRAQANEAWTKRFFAQPIAFKPGTRFLYDSPATYMLSAMVQKATGESVLAYLKPRAVRSHRLRRTRPGRKPTGDLRRGLRPDGTHRGHRALRAIVPAEGRLAGSAAHPGEPGSSRRPPCRPAMAAIPRAIGTRATASSSGAAATTPTAATVHSGSTASSCRTTMR
jgi:CubicO group peptidase (beta-lactamase class C family)